MGRSCSIVVACLLNHSKLAGLSPANAAGTARKKISKSVLFFNLKNVNLLIRDLSGAGGRSLDSPLQD